MLLSLLTETDTPETPWGSYLFMGILIAIVVVFMVLNRQTQKKRQQETMDMLNAIQPGNKVKTIGGICGVVVEVCPEDNTFILETGSEQSGKSYIKFDKQAVYQTDAVAKKEEIVPVEEAAEEEKVALAEEIFEEVAADPVETVEEPVEEATEEIAEEAVEEPAEDTVEE
jgi:preprotein translocase subunit YajC